MLLLAGGFGLVAITLAAIGVYGVIALGVSERRGEVGVRVALGATPSNILWLVLWQAIRLASVGVGIGLVASLVLTRFMARQLFGVTASDVSTLLGTATVLVAVSMLAAILPAIRAMRIDPIAALKSS